MNDYRVRRLVGASGRVWIVDEREQAEQASSGQSTPFYGWPEDDEGQRYWMQRAIGGSDSWEEEREHLRRAFRIGRLPEVVASPFIHGAVDLIEQFDVYLVSELAETDLRRALLNGPLDPDDLAALVERLRAALDVLHRLRLVHSDLREDNVLRVDGEWKLGDLGGVVGFGEPIVSIQVDEAYRLGGAALNAPAAPENDLHALAVLLEHATHRQS